MTRPTTTAIGRAAITLMVLGALSVSAAAQTAPAGPAAVVARPASSALEGSSGWYLKGRFLAGVQAGPTLSPFFRFNSGRTGWGPTFGLNWTTTTLSADTGTGNVAVARLKLRPVMAGISYAHVFGRVRVNAGVVGGYTFNTVEPEVALPPGVQASVRLTNAWAAGPKAGATLALTRRLALTASAAYVFTDPKIETRVVRDGAQVYSSSGRVRGDSLSLRVGLGVSLF